MQMRIHINWIKYREFFDAQDERPGTCIHPPTVAPARLWAACTRSTTTGWSPGCSAGDRKSTRLNSSHTVISYAVFCLKKKTLNSDASLAMTWLRDNNAKVIRAAVTRHFAPGPVAGTAESALAQLIADHAQCYDDHVEQ